MERPLRIVRSSHRDLLQVQNELFCLRCKIPLPDGSKPISWARAKDMGRCLQHGPGPAHGPQGFGGPPGRGFAGVGGWGGGGPSHSPAACRTLAHGPGLAHLAGICPCSWHGPMIWAWTHGANSFFCLRSMSLNLYVYQSYFYGHSHMLNTWVHYR